MSILDFNISNLYKLLVSIFLANSYIYSLCFLSHNFEVTFQGGDLAPSGVGCAAAVAADLVTRRLLQKLQGKSLLIKSSLRARGWSGVGMSGIGWAVITPVLVTQIEKKNMHATR